MREEGFRPLGVEGESDGNWSNGFSAKSWFIFFINRRGNFTIWRVFGRGATGGCNEKKKFNVQRTGCLFLFLFFSFGLAREAAALISIEEEAKMGAEFSVQVRNRFDVVQDDLSRSI